MRGKIFFLNIMSNYGLVILKMLIGIWSLPIYLKNFGSGNYGLFLIALELPQLLSFIDLGSSKSILRFSAEYKNDNDVAKFSQALSVNGTISIASSILVAAVITVLGLFSSSIYKLSPEQYSLAISLFTISGVSSLFVFIGLIPQNILSGHSIFFERNKLQIFNICYSVGLLLCLSYLKFGIILFSILLSLGYVISVLLDVWLISRKKILENISFRIVSFKAIFKSGFLRYNIHLFFLSLLALLSTQSDKQILGITIGLQSVAVYVIITKPYYVLKGLFANFYTVLRPLIVTNNSDNKDNVRRIVNLTIQTIPLMFLIIAVYMFFLWPYLSETWIGNLEYSRFNYCAALAVLNLGLSSFSGVIIAYYVMTGRSSVVLIAELVTVPINLIISVLLCLQYGVIGVIIGTSIQMILNLIWFFYHAIKDSIMDIQSLFSLSFLVILGCIVSAVFIISLFDLSVTQSLILCIILLILFVIHLFKMRVHRQFYKLST